MFEGAMISANVQQKQQQQHQQQQQPPQQQHQVDNKKATNANYIRKSQINLAQYTQSSNNRNILCENSYYGGIGGGLATDYQAAIDLSGNQLLSPQTTNVSSSTAAIVGATNPAAAQLSSSTSIASNILSVDSTSTTNILNDQISVLFPKCRPKNDANLNKTSLYIDTTHNTALASASLLLASSPTHGDYKNQNQLFDDSEHIGNSTLIDNSRAYTRNMNNQNAENATLNDGGGTGEIMQNNIGGIGETTSAPRMNHSGYPARCESFLTISSSQ